MLRQRKKLPPTLRAFNRAAGLSLALQLRAAVGGNPLSTLPAHGEAADILETMVGPGFHLVHTHRMGWLLRQLESWPDWQNGRSWQWVDVDSAPEGQLGALLIRHQERERTRRDDPR